MTILSSVPNSSADDGIFGCRSLLLLYIVLSILLKVTDEATSEFRQQSLYTSRRFVVDISAPRLILLRKTILSEL